MSNWFKVYMTVLNEELNSEVNTNTLFIVFYGLINFKMNSSKGRNMWFPAYVLSAKLIFS